jgi:hypothetical protein
LLNYLFALREMPQLVHKSNDLAASANKRENKAGVEQLSKWILPFIQFDTLMESATDWNSARSDSDDRSTVGCGKSTA